MLNIEFWVVFTRAVKICDHFILNGVLEKLLLFYNLITWPSLI